MKKECIQVPYVTGRDVSQFTMPDGACDCHFHIFDPINFPYKESDVRNQAPATVDCYRLFMRHTGVDRCVIVTPSCYGFDNSCTISALRRLGSCARAVVVVDSSVSDEQLQEMNRYGVRGIRFNVVSGNDETIRNAVSLSERVAKLGWHTDFYMSPDLIIKMKNVLEDYPTQIVLDHMGSMPKDPGVKHEAYDFILSLIRASKGYVEISCFYLHSKEADYSDIIEEARIDETLVNVFGRKGSELAQTKHLCMRVH